MKSAPTVLEKIRLHCDQLLNHAGITDWSGAKNGLQVANNGQIKKIAAAVDASERSIRAAIAARANLLVVHHGLFWSDITPVTGPNYRKLKLLLDHNLALYSSHLPLDAHPTLGNNALLARALGLRNQKRFFNEKGTLIGFQGSLHLTRTELATRLKKILGAPPHVIDAGPARIKTAGIVTGGAGAELSTAAREGLDAFITGEGPHWTDNSARDLGINVFYGGHYLTETFGVKALAAHLSKKYRLPWEFIDFPTGL